MHACRRIDWHTLTRSHCPTRWDEVGIGELDRLRGWDGHADAGQPGLGWCRCAHHLRACRSRFQRCSVFFRGFSVLVLLCFYFLSRPSQPCCLLPAEGCGCLIGPSFQYRMGPLAPLVLEPLLSASAQSPCFLPLLLRCDVQAARDRSARPSQPAPFRQRGPKVSANKHVPEVDRAMDQSRAERCLSVDSFSSNAMGLKSCLCQALFSLSSDF